MKHPLVPRGKELGLPVISGILLAISFPPFHLLFPPFIALVPYLVFVARSGGDKTASRSVARGSFWMGIVYYGMVLYWLFTALVWYTWLSLLAYIGAIVIMSGFLAAGGFAIHTMRVRHGMPFWISVPVFIVTVEWLRAQLGHLAFPWLGLGHSLTGFPYLVGFADIMGARGVTFWLAAINGLAAEWWLAGFKQRWHRWAVALLLLIGLPVSYSLFRWFTLQTRPVARVLVVQPNIPEDLKLDRQIARDTSRAALGALTREALARDSEIDLVLWPETAHPGFFEIDRSWTLWAASIARRSGTPLLYGTLDIERYDDGSFDYYNAALFLNQEGTGAGVYRKHYLVPIVERIPYVPIAWMRSIRRSAQDWHLPLIGNIGGFLRWFGGFGAGNQALVLSLDEDSGFGVLICYESIFPQLARTYRKDGADFLVNITNDSWFGRSRPWWSRTSALYQHPAHLVMRAIENRMGVARSANTGISGFVDPRGRNQQLTQLFRPTAVAGIVRTTDGLTIYTRLGDWVGWLAALAAFGLIAWSTWIQRNVERRNIEDRAE